MITQSRAGRMAAVFVFALAGGCGDCSVTPQAAVVPVLVCPSVWGQMLPPGCFASSYKDGTCREWLGKGRCQAKAKFFLFSTHKEGESSPSSLPVAAAWHLLSHCPLTGLSTTPLTTRGCRSVGQQQPLSLLSCWFAWLGPGWVLACPTESGALLKMVANNVCGLPGKHVVELSL